MDLYLFVVSKLLISDRPKSKTLDHCFGSYRICLLQIFLGPNSWPPSASCLYGWQMVTDLLILPGRFAILYMGSLFLVFQCSKTASLERPFWFLVCGICVSNRLCLFGLPDIRRYVCRGAHSFSDGGHSDVVFPVLSQGPCREVEKPLLCPGAVWSPWRCVLVYSPGSLFH